MEISVVIPTFNRADLLPRAIDSVRAQSLAPAEIIIVDDGSTDDTEPLIGSRYPECRYIYQDNRGVSAARNRGIRAARGDWIALLDSDDTWLPTKLATQRERLAREPSMLLCHTEERWVRNGTRVNQMKKHAKSGGWIFRLCLPLCAISPSSTLIHRRLFEDVGLFDESLPACEDYDLWLRICARYPVTFEDREQIVKYGGHDDQLSRKHWGMDRFRVQALCKIIESGTLGPGDLRAAADMLIRKAEILAQGARKRDNEERYGAYRTLIRQYRPFASDAACALDEH